MAGTRHQTLDIHAVHTKSSACFRHAAGIGLGQVGGRQHGTHAPPTATANGLDHHARHVGRKEGLGLNQRDGALAARHQRHALLLGQRTRSGLVTKQGQVLRAGADEDQACVGTGLREVGAFA